MRIYFRNETVVDNVISVLDGDKQFCCFRGSLELGGKELSIVVMHGTKSLAVNKKKIQDLPLRKEFLEKASFLTCWGSRFPQSITHLARTNGSIAVTGFYVLSSDTFYMEVEDRS